MAQNGWGVGKQELREWKDKTVSELSITTHAHTTHRLYKLIATQRDIQPQKDKNHMIVIALFPLVFSIIGNRLHKHFYDLIPATFSTNILASRCIAHNALKGSRPYTPSTRLVWKLTLLCCCLAWTLSTLVEISVTSPSLNDWQVPDLQYSTFVVFFLIPCSEVGYNACPQHTLIEQSVNTYDCPSMDLEMGFPQIYVTVHLTLVQEWLLYYSILSASWAS